MKFALFFLWGTIGFTLDCAADVSKIGEVIMRAVSKEGDTVIYQIQSKNFAAHLFRQEDINDYANRVNRRNCSDSDLTFLLRHGKSYRYDLYGSDGVNAGVFYTTLATCQKMGLIR